MRLNLPALEVHATGRVSTRAPPPVAARATTRAISIVRARVEIAPGPCARRGRVRGIRGRGHAEGVTHRSNLAASVQARRGLVE